MMGLSVTLFLVAVVAFVLFEVVQVTRSNARLGHFKGPFLAKLSNAWLFWQSVNKNVYQTEKDVLKKYGSPARIGPNRLVTDDPDVVRHINAPTSKWTRSDWYEPMKFDPRLDNVFSTKNEKLHAELKSKEVGAYSGRDAPCLEGDVDECVVEFLQLVDSYNGKSMDFAIVARWFTLDVLSNVAFGRKFGYMAAKKDLWNYIDFGESFWSILELCVNHYWFYRFLTSPPIAALTAPKPTDTTGIGPVLTFARNAVADRFGDKPIERKDMLNSFKTKGLSREQMEVEAHLQVLAGQDSTTTVLRSILYALVGTPVAYMKLRAEVDKTVASNAASSPVITYDESKKLPYMHACIWEGIRMWPPLFGLKTKLAPRGGDTIKGVFYPEGTELGLCDDAIQRNADIFGEDAHIYRPERWIEADHETFVKYTRTADLVFGAGKYVCLGKHIAMTQVYKSVFELFRHYDWAMTDPLKGIDSISQVTHTQSNMNLIAIPRH